MSFSVIDKFYKIFESTVFVTKSKHLLNTLSYELS